MQRELFEKGRNTPVVENELVRTDGMLTTVEQARFSAIGEIILAMEMVFGDTAFHASVQATPEIIAPSSNWVVVRLSAVRKSLLISAVW